MGKISRQINRWIVAVLLTLILGFPNFSAFGRALFVRHQATEGSDGGKDYVPCTEVATHDIGKMGFSLNNLGQIGKGFSGISGDYPSCIYPYPGNNEYLFGGALWVGSIVGQDTLVSVGADGWNYVREMWPDPCPFGAIDTDTSPSRQKFTAVYTDTVFDQAIVFPDPYDMRPHIPLNIEITQESYAWNYKLAEDFVIINYSIKNIGDYDLQSVYMGFIVDGDVLFNNASTGYQDDICGFKESIQSMHGCGFVDTVNLAWIADNDGKQNTSDSYCTLPSVTGMRLLRSPSDSLDISFNWWISNANPTLDWGPRLEGTAEDPFRDFGGFLGTPAGDRNKHYIMRHEEIDYDQLFAAIDQTSQGWLPPPTYALDLANGSDTRYLLSFGPFAIGSGEILPIAMAYVAGENFHREPCDAFENLFDPLNPYPYNAQLNFDDFGKNAVMADWVYDNPGIDTDGDGYYGKFRICGNDTLYYEGDGVPDFNPLFICGDINVDGTINLLDMTSLITYLFKEGPIPPGMILADVDNSGEVNLIDITYLISFLYKDGPQPDCDL